MTELLVQARQRPTAAALIDAHTGEVWSYERLDQCIESAAQAVAGEKRLALVCVRRDVPSLIAYLGALRAGHAVLPIEADLDSALRDDIIARYQPEILLAASSNELSSIALQGRTAVALDETPFVAFVSAREAITPLHRELSLLLSTSGSTGSPKLVRLSEGNVLANADAIRVALRIDETERAVTGLAFSYSFGLSVVHSHLLAGASLIVSNSSLTSPDLWTHIREYQATSFAGVPFTFEILRRIGFASMPLPRLRTLTQAGGKLGVDLVRYFHELMHARGGVFVPMYGQTEATARIAILPPGRLPEKLGSVGVPIPGARVRVRRIAEGAGPDDPDLPPGQDGELFCEGPSVMMGYAETREDLSRGDELQGVLATGDTGYVDTDGFIYITGRLKRFAKLHGHRVSLDDVEGQLQGAGAVAVVDGGDRLLVCCSAASRDAVSDAILALATRMQTNPRGFVIRTVDAMPLLPSGKIDYRSLREIVTTT